MATPRASITPAAESDLWPRVLAALPERGPAYDAGVPSEWIWRLVQRPAESGDWALQRMVDAGLLVRIDGAGGPWWRKVLGAVVPAPVDQFGGLAAGAVLRVIDGAKNVEGQMPVTTSAGAADAGKIPQLDAAGKLDPSLVDGIFATDAEVTAAIAAHEAAGNPHPGYATDADLAAHAAAANPHSGSQPLDALLSAISALATVADRLIYCTGVDTVALTTFTAAARTLMAAVDAAAQRTAMELGTAATQNVGLGPLGTSITTDRLIGRDTAGTGGAEQITVSGGLEFSGSGGIRRSAITGPVTIAAGATTSAVANDAITNAMLRNAVAWSVIGRSANSAGDPADIAASADGDVLRRSGTTLGFGQIVPSAIGSVTTARLLGRTTAGTGTAEHITVGSNLTLGSGELRFSWWKPQSIMLNATGDTAAPTTIDVTDAAGMVDAVIGSTWAVPCIRLADGAWVFVIL